MPVTVEVRADLRFNVADFDDLTSIVSEDQLELAADGLVARVTGAETPRSAPAPLTPLHTFQRDDGSEVTRVPRGVSREVVALLNHGFHPKYAYEDGTLDRSRAVYAAAMSLLAAGLSQGQVESMLTNSALRGAAKDRGRYGPKWLHGQVEKAAAYLAAQAKKGHAQ